MVQIVVYNYSFLGNMVLSKCSVVSCIEGGVDLIASGRSLVADQYLPSCDVFEVILLLLGVSFFSYCSVEALCVWDPTTSVRNPRQQ